MPLKTTWTGSIDFEKIAKSSGLKEFKIQESPTRYNIRATHPRLNGTIEIQIDKAFNHKKSTPIRLIFHPEDGDTLNFNLRRDGTVEVDPEAGPAVKTVLGQLTGQFQTIVELYRNSHTPTLHSGLIGDRGVHARMGYQPGGSESDPHTEATGRPTPSLGVDARHVTPYSISQQAFTAGMDEKDDPAEVQIFLRQQFETIAVDIESRKSGEESITREEAVQQIYDYFSPFLMEPLETVNEGLIRSGISVDSHRDFVSMPEQGNAPKIKKEAATIKEALALLNGHEWELNTTPSSTKETTARISSLSKAKRNSLKKKEALSEEELTTLVEYLFKIFDYKALDPKTAKERKDEILGAVEDSRYLPPSLADIEPHGTGNKGFRLATANRHWRTDDEPISRLYEVAARHLELIFLMCPALQEKHMMDIIKKFIEAVCADHNSKHKANKDKLSPAIVQKETLQILLNRHPWYADFITIQEENLQEEIDFLIEDCQAFFSEINDSHDSLIATKDFQTLKQSYEEWVAYAKNKNLNSENQNAVIESLQIIVKQLEEMVADAEDKLEDIHGKANASRSSESETTLSLTALLVNPSVSGEIANSGVAPMEDEDSDVTYTSPREKKSERSSYTACLSSIGAKARKLHASETSANNSSDEKDRVAPEEQSVANANPTNPANAPSKKRGRDAKDAKDSPSVKTPRVKLTGTHKRTRGDEEDTGLANMDMKDDEASAKEAAIAEAAEVTALEALERSKPLPTLRRAAH